MREGGEVDRGLNGLGSYQIRDMFLIIPLLFFMGCVGESCRNTLSLHLDETYESR